MKGANVLKVIMCKPFNGRLATNGIINAWLLPRLLKSPIWGKTITEQDLYDFLIEACPDHKTLFNLAKLEDVLRKG